MGVGGGGDMTGKYSYYIVQAKHNVILSDFAIRIGNKISANSIKNI